MTKSPQQPDDFRAEDDVDQFLGHAHVNPKRTGCPPREVLAALARRERPIGDPGYEHIANCSPCYREFRSLQQRTPSRIALAFRSRAPRLAAAAVIFVGALTVWLLLAPGPEDTAPARNTLTQVKAELDLRKYTVTRSENSGGAQPAVSLPRANLQMTLLLPVGSEPGAYEVQLLDADLRARAAAQGHAEIRKYITTLETTIDLQSLPAGGYRLALRRQGEGWQMFPATLR